MYKILVIDDEKSIVKGLVETLNREEDLELQVYDAWTVSEGISIAKEVKLDILCTDINMPVMDGFEFAKAVLEYWKDCKVVFLTGYDTFDYIYKAIHEFGGKYILKNEEDKFIEIIRKCILELDTTKQLKLEQIKMLQLLDENKKNRKQQIWFDFLRNNVSVHKNGDLKKIYQEDKILLGEPIQIAVGKILLQNNQLNSETTLYQVFYQVKEEYQYFYELDCIRLYSDTHIILAQKKENQTPKLEEFLSGFQTRLVEQEGMKVSFLYSEEHTNFEQLKEQVKLFTTLLNIKLLKKNPVLINIEEMLTENKDQYVSREQCELQIDKMLIERRFMELADIFLGLFLSVKNTYELSLADTQMYYKCIGKVASYIEKSVNYRDMPEELQRNYYHLRYMSGIDEIHHFVMNFLKYMDNCQEKKEGMEDDLVVQKIEAYVLNHITAEITLNSLAKMVYFNPSYLSRFYKAATGRKLSQFIKDAKMLKAKELLESSDKKIGDISKLLGFESVGYFTVFFKKQTGMTPTEYRAFDTPIQNKSKENVKM